VPGNLLSHIVVKRLRQLPEALCKELRAARNRHGWSQAELGRRVGLPQMHISGIESGKIVPRFDTLLDLVRTLDYDLLMVPRPLVPAVQAMVREHGAVESGGSADGEERPLYATGAEPDERPDEA
jgi:transcriptional regulator with XRE-family HTH domain